MSAVATLAVPAPLGVAVPRAPWGAFAALAAFAAAASLALVLDDYWFNAILIPFTIMSLAGLGLNLLTGYSGQASLGSGAFMLVGAYATYNLMLRLPELGLALHLVGGGLFAAAAGAFFGLPALRIRGFYLAAATLAAQFFLPWLFNEYGWFSNHATSSSISAPKLRFLGFDLGGPAGRYLLALTATAALTLVATNLVRGRIGRDWAAIRDMDTAAAVAGIRVGQRKLLAFAVSSFFLGVAGALWAFAYLGTVDSRSFDLDRSFTILFIVIIGGLGSIPGAFLGAAFVVLLPLAMSNLSAALFAGAVGAAELQNLQKIVFGALIVALLIKEPKGLWALVRALARRIALWPLRA